VASRLGIVKNPAIVNVVGGTLVTDTLALSVLAVVAGSLAGDLDAMFWLRLVGILAIYVTVVLVAVPRIGSWFFRNVPAQAPAEFLFLMVVLFAAAWAADLAGAEPIIGAFLAGLTLNRLIPLTSPLMTRVRFVGNALFIPFFLLSVGMLVDPRVVIGSAEVWAIAGALIAMVHVGKFLGAWTTKRLFGYNREEGLAIYGLSVPQAAATLAVTFVGLEIGLFGEEVVNAVILMIVVTVFVGPSLVEKFGREIALQEERKPYDPSEAPLRILIPISNPATVDGLMDIALLLRGKGSDEPLYPAMVVRGTEEGSEAMVAEAERMLSHAILYAAEADVPVHPLTRVDRNIATGISRAMAETRTSVVVVGWDGQKSGKSRTAVFGTVLDQLLEETRQTVLVATLGHALNTTERVVVVIPPGTDHHPGFLGAIRVVKTLASELDARFEALVVKEDPEGYHARFKGVKPELPMEFEGVEGWGPLLWELRSRLEPQDLVVVLSARRNTLSWHRELERLPGQLASLVPESFIMVYPSRAEPTIGLPEVGKEVLPTYLAPERIVFDVPGGEDYRRAFRAIVAAQCGDDEERLRDIVARLEDCEKEFSSEIRPGVALPHALVRGLDEPLMFLGVSPEGVRFPHTAEPVKAIFVLLSPLERQQDHLRLLTRMARLIRDSDELDDLKEIGELQPLYAWFEAQLPVGPKTGARKGG
jgi:mannitol/fructose-specific phosphotransferase system IIA component (Ntr-type)